MLNDGETWLEWATRVVSHAEEEFASGAEIPDAFEPFCRGGATTRTQAAHALYIVIADYYVRAASNPGVPELMRHFERYAALVEDIAMRILGDGIKLTDPNPEQAFGNWENVASFVAFLKTLDHTTYDFWTAVMERIEFDPSQLQRKPWWRFW